MISHDFPFDPTNGFTPEELLKLPPPEEVPTFRSFWEETYSLVMSHTPYWCIEKEIWSPESNTRIYQIKTKTWDGREIVMWIARPENSRGGLVIGQGYGNAATPILEPELTVAYPCIRGLGLSQCKDIPWEVKKHVLWGIGSRETYILRGAVTDLWTAATILLDMFPDTKENLNYSGSSMGGGMGALMLPWDRRFHSAYLHVPSFGGNPLRLKYESCGSGEAVRQYILAHEEGKKVLDFFDAAVSARYLSIPTILQPAVFDPVVAPAGQFSICNTVPEKFKKVLVLETGHYPETENTRKGLEEGKKFMRSLFLQAPACKKL